MSHNIERIEAILWIGMMVIKSGENWSNSPFIIFRF